MRQSRAARDRKTANGRPAEGKTVISRRSLLATFGLASAHALAGPLIGGRLLWAADDAGAAAQATVDSGEPFLAGRPLVRYPEKTDLILLTSRPPQLETPVRYFDRAITPNEAFYVRYHVFPIPTEINLDSWRLKITGEVDRPLELSMDDLRSKFQPARVVAVQQCSGNSRGRVSPHPFGGQWGDGAMGNAEWVGASLADILKAAGVRSTAVDVTFNGLDQPAAPGVPDLIKGLSIGRIMDDPTVLVAYQMNGQPLPMLNGFPARIVVPGWYSTYWVKNLAEISVLDRAFDGFWVKTAYRIPDTACGCVEAGTKPARTVPISRMKVRSVIAVPGYGARVRAGRPVALKGVAFDGGYGIGEVLVSEDNARTWKSALLENELGPYSFRVWSYNWTAKRPGVFRLMVRAVSKAGESQPLEALWNPSGYLYNAVQHLDVTAV
ncbi:MAG TPA: molybdopterin-dependent oxidoreductase [Terriglobia bacterium]|jgi:sulfite dehydrogenase|nr:molybdopterin-dependent oxidoreductase [Terriglobia bacterium]